jgi:hypothetical protein
MDEHCSYVPLGRRRTCKGAKSIPEAPSSRSGSKFRGPNSRAVSWKPLLGPPPSEAAELRRPDDVGRFGMIGENGYHSQAREKTGT